MRPLLIALSLLGLSACAASPASLGITGPGQRTVPTPGVAPGDSTDVVPGVSTTGTFYGPTNGGPQTGSSGFWGYN
jgi:hypothetical protein